jgi:proton-translocating NADH-quinone oxidoreductase chain N
VHYRLVDYSAGRGGNPLILNDLIFLLPELILLLAATMLFILDIVGRQPRDPAAATRRPQPWLPYAALIGLAAAALGLLPGLGQTAPVTAMLAADPFAIFFKALAIIGVALVIVAAIPYMRSRTPYRGEFYALLLIATAAICLAVGATNFVMLYLAMEFLSITSYILAGFFREDRKSGEAAIKYFLYGATASAVMLYGMSLLYGATGTTDFGGVAQALGKLGGSDLLWLGGPAIILMVVGFGFKASLVPFHQWAPDTYEGAPTPVTAFLSTASKAAGFAILIRVFLVALGGLQPLWAALLAAVAILTMTLGNLTAIRQTNIKRMLAFSSIAQAGYILIGVAAAGGSAAASPFGGVNGVLIYLLAYLVTNVGAFAAVIAIENRSGKVAISDYAGLARRTPWLAVTLFIFLLSLAGIPPTAGFVGKLFVFGAAVRAALIPLAVVAALNAVVSAFYYLNVVRVMFFVPVEADAEPIVVARPLQIAVLLTAALTLLIGLFPGPLIQWATQSVRLLALR